MAPLASLTSPTPLFSVGSPPPAAKTPTPVPDTASPTPLSPVDITADFKIRTMPGFALEATFSKQGQDAMRFEMRHKGGEWQFVTVLTSSPGTFVITPATPGEAEQVEIRSIMIKKNQMVGNYSDTKTALIAP